jgi:hypothetical protein
MLSHVMAYSAADLRMVDDHIAQGERHVTRQEEIIAWLTSRGHPTEMAEQLLLEFQATLLQHRAHRELMLHENEMVRDPVNRRVSAPSRAPGRPKQY